MRLMLLVSLLIALWACSSPMSVETRTPGAAGELTLEERIQIKRQQERGHR